MFAAWGQRRFTAPVLDAAGWTLSATGQAMDIGRDITLAAFDPLEDGEASRPAGVGADDLVLDGIRRYIREARLEPFLIIHGHILRQRSRFDILLA